MTAKLKLRDDTKVEIPQFFWKKDGESYIVWREGGSSFVELSEDSLTALRLLQERKSLQEVSQTLEEKYGEIYDVKRFISELAHLGFVSSIGGTPVPLSQPKGGTFPFINRKHVSWVYSRPLLICYLVLIGFTLLILASYPAYLPRYSDYFFHESYLITLVISTLTGFALVSIHELAHLIAGKAVGVHGYFSLGMRLYLPVAETNLTQLWKVPRRKRYIPFLAGLLNDGLFVAVTIILLWLSDLGLVPRVELIYAFGKFLVLVLSFGIIWQFLFFVRTDIYYVVSNLLGCRNLYNDSWNLILNTLPSSLGLRTRSVEIPTEELRIIKLYAPFMLIATVMSISAFTLFGLPILFQIFLEAIQTLSLGYKANLLDFVEGLLLTCLTSLHIVGFVYFSARGFLQLRKRLKEYRISTD